MLPVQPQRGTRGWPLPAAALCALSTTLAAPAPNLKGATLCLSPLLSVSVTAEAGTSLPLAGLETRVYNELRTLLRAGGVRFREENVCRRSNAGLALSLRVRPIRGSSALETQVSAAVQDGTRPGATAWMGGEFRWSGVEYGQAEATAAGVTAEWLRELRASLGQLIRDWKAANP